MSRCFPSESETFDFESENDETETEMFSRFYVQLFQGYHDYD